MLDRNPVNDVEVCRDCGTANRAGEVRCHACGSALGEPPPTSAEMRRIITILFSDVTGSMLMGEQLDPESLRRVMARYFSEMTSVLERHGATVEKYIGDAVMAVFGLPVAHEDDALRAVRAAAEMRGALRVLNDELERTWGVRIRTRTGLNTGEVLAADADLRQSLVVGDAVNVAARLEQAAEPGDILIGESTFRLVRDAVSAEPVGPLDVKGKSEPVPAWRVVEVLPSVTGWSRRLDSPLVGREAELDRLRDSFDQVRRASTSRVVTLMGGAGIGKSRLTAEFLLELADVARVAQGRCMPYGEGITFRPVAEILREVAGTSESTPSDETRARVDDLLGTADDAPVVAERLVNLLNIDEGATASIQETFWAVRRLLEVMGAASPVVIVLDDIQWAEPTLLDLIEYLTDWLGAVPVMILCLARPELLDARPGWLEARANASMLALEPLPPGGIERLIGNLVDEADLAEGARQRITEIAEGNPLFVEETLRMLVDDGLLQLIDDRWTAVGDLSDPFIPPTIHALITARLDRLAPDERAIIERASIVGREFWWGAVSDLAPPELQKDVTRLLQSLSRKELIRPGQSNLPGEDAFEFTHILVRDAAYQAIPKETRADLHELLADWIERRTRGSPIDHEEIVGYHLEQVFRSRVELGPVSERTEEQGRRAAALLGASGRRAFSRGDMPAAVNLLSRAASLLPADDPLRLDVLPRLAFSLMEIGDFERLMSVVGETKETATTLDDPQMLAHATILELYIRLFTSPGSWAEEAEREAHAAIATFERAGDDSGLAKSWSLLGLVNVTNGRFAPAQAAWEEAAEHASDAGEERDALDALSWVLLTLWAGPAPVEHGLRRSHEIQERAGTDHKGRASAMFMRAVFEVARGHVEGARQLIAQARALLQEVALTVWMAGPLTQMAGIVELSAGDPAAAERELSWGYETLSEVGEMAWQHTLIALLAEAVYDQGRYDEAEELARRSEEMAGGEDVWSQVLWRRVVARVGAHRDELDEAETLIGEAIDLAEATDSLQLRGLASMGLAEVLELAGRPTEAAAAVHEAVDVFERKGDIQSARSAGARLEHRAV
jgi:class 3 adenylate cyclase/tetratricopeptide (TPR) repeat protein